MSCNTNPNKAADAAASSGVSRTASASAFLSRTPARKGAGFSWRGYGNRIKAALRAWRSAADDEALLRLRAELAAEIARRAGESEEEEYPAGRGQALAEERARLLNTPPGWLSVAERVERIAVLDDALAVMRREKALNEAQYRAALVDTPWGFKSHPSRSAAPVVWLPERPAGAEVVSVSRADPTRAIRARLRVVELDEAITSNTLTGNLNPAYDQRLQPRRRNRAASTGQIERIAAKLEPDALLRPDADWGSGPPIVNRQGMVESGNGRVLALRMAREKNPAAYNAYRQKLLARAESLGLAREEVARLSTPVLLRERLSNLDRREQLRFIAAANSAGVARMGAAEQARADAGRIPPGLVSTLRIAPSDRSLSDALRKKGNAPFARRFLELLPETERGALLDEKGNLGAAGVQRIERALFAYALPGRAGERLSRLIYEEGEALDRVSAGLKMALPGLAALEDRIRAGDAEENLRLGSDLAAAVEVMRDLRGKGLSVNDYLRQHKMFPELSAFQEQILIQLDARRRSGRAVAELLKAYTTRALRSPAPGQRSLPGQPRSPVTPTGIFRAALKDTGGTWVAIKNWSAAQQAAAGFDIPAAEIQEWDASQQQLGMVAASRAAVKGGQKKPRGVNWQRRWQVKDKGGKAYTVARDDKGRWGCSCPQWIYQRKPPDARPDWWRKPCPHIKQIQQTVNNE